MNCPAPSAVEEKRPVLHKLIDELPVEDLEVVERLLARLEMDRLWNDLRDGVTQDWADGKYDRVDELICKVRADLKQSEA